LIIVFLSGIIISSFYVSDCQNTTSVETTTGIEKNEIKDIIGYSFNTTLSK
jgi:hypothetical protein